MKKYWKRFSILKLLTQSITWHWGKINYRTDCSGFLWSFITSHNYDSSSCLLINCLNNCWINLQGTVYAWFVKWGVYTLNEGDPEFIGLEQTSVILDMLASCSRKIKKGHHYDFSQNFCEYDSNIFFKLACTLKASELFLHQIFLFPSHVCGKSLCNVQITCSLNPVYLQIHEPVETINQLKTSRDFLLSFAKDPQEFINNWLISQTRDLKVLKAGLFTVLVLNLTCLWFHYTCI